MTTTNFNEFAKTVIAEMKRQLADYEITEQSVIKMNDITLHGVTVRHKDSDVAPTMYLDASYEDYCNGQSIEDIVEYLVTTVRLSEPIAPIKMTEEMDFSFETIKDKLTARLIDTKLNKNYLESHPYGLVGAGLAIVAEINISDNYRCVITHDMAKQFNLNISEVLATALENMSRNHPAKLTDMSATLFGAEAVNLLNGDNTSADGLTILQSDGAEGFGAVALIYSGVADRIHEVYGTDYYILPSSVHEVLILQDNGQHSVDDLKEMVISANQTVVDSLDVLSNSVFHYGAEGLRRVA